MIQDNQPVPTRAQRLYGVIKSWTFVLVLINAAVFVAMCVIDQSIMVPSDHVLDLFGAKNAKALLAGEYWRLITPMFIHIGIIHFTLNMLALFYVGRHIEKQVGGRWYICMYLVAGITGVISSFLFTFGQSAGASGAIFGIVGVGFVFERFFMRNMKRDRGIVLRRGPYTGLVIANVIIGFILTSGPVRIDNGAHLGGLFSGMILGLAYLFLTPNHLTQTRPRAAYGLMSALTIFLIGGICLASSPEYLKVRTIYVAQKPWFNVQTRYEALTEGIKTFPDEDIFYFLRGRLLALDHQLNPALEDFNQIIVKEEWRHNILLFTEQLSQQGDPVMSSKLRKGLVLGNTVE